MTLFIQEKSRGIKDLNKKDKIKKSMVYLS